MNPALSVVVFTTAAGAGQGLVVAIALAALTGIPLAPASLRGGLAIAIVLLVVGLAASFLHLGRPSRAWRAWLMWRTSWLSREVIVLPAFIALVAAWWLAARDAAGAPPSPLLPLAAIAVSALLWLCTAMIYACLRFIEEWAQPLTVVNFVLLGLSSGLVLACALAALAGDSRALAAALPAALVATVVGGAARVAALRRNATLRHRSTLQSATGIVAARLVQTSMGMSAGSFNTREFFHRASAAALRTIKVVAVALAFVVPALVIALVWAGALPAAACAFAALAQAPGLLADRWLFLAQAKHPQNLYYQVVS
ncbi:MAG TPA: DmsC/YnfH family molybdoenzyme membrane anchor subunit [Caldimonas sp.]|nr:DmsC/YnfH family molybdoenzyme membrane anchor subunit [Caldimonas sp.]